MISGTTRLFGIVCDPVAHVRTPEVMNAYFARNGADAVLVPLHVRPDDLVTMFAAVRGLQNLGGLVVTVPHKSAVLALCDEVGEQARLVGAANAVRRHDDGRLTCDMFDGKGFLGGLLAQGHDPRGLRVLQLGAGGAGAAVAFALAEHGAAALTIANRSRAKAEELAERVASAYSRCNVDVQGATPDPAGFDLVVNTTSLGMREEDPIPLRIDTLGPDTLVAEIVMKPERTPLVAAAEERGCRVHLGRHMLDAQVRLLADYLGAVPDRAAPG